jgi:peptide/nickel transport system substrate-binding protein
MKNFITMSVAMLLTLIITTGATLSVEKSITIGMQLEPPNLNPTAGAAAAIDEVVYANVFEGLTRFKSDGSIVPSLAKSWNISSNGLTYTFYLRSNVEFHDGTKMTARDVKFSLDRARSEESTNAQKTLFTNIASIKVIDKKTVEVSLKIPNGGFITNLAWGDAIVVSEKTIAQAETAPVGTGPFEFLKWVKGDRVELVKNNNYWGESIYLDKATFKFISDPTAAFAAVMAGDIDAFPVFPAPENLSQFAADPRFKVIVGSTEGETILSTNNKKPPFDKLEMRKALAHAINREEIIDGAMFGFGTPIGTHFAPHNPDYLDLTANSNYDPELSKKLIKESGYDQNTVITLKLPPPSYARRGGEIVASQLRNVGLNIKILNLEWAQWLEQVFKGKDYNLTIVSHTEPSDINIYARPNYYFQYDSEAFQDLMKELGGTSAPKKRSNIIQKAQIIISENYVNGYLFQLAKTGVANKKIKGLWENSPTQANDLTSVMWSE